MASIEDRAHKNNGLRQQFIGTARIALSSLEFAEGRQIDPEIVNNLKVLFRKTGCRRHDPDNYIPAFITDREMRDALRITGLKQGSFKTPSKDGSLHLLRIPEGTQTFCLHGRHRIQAAREFMRADTDKWWSVNLYLVTEEEKSQESLIASWRDQFLHQSSFSDGEIYRKLRFHGKRTATSSNRKQVEKWTVRLSRCKQIGYQQLIKHKELTARFDSLLMFPGLWDGLELGNIQRHLALRCDEELMQYLNHVHAVWGHITMNEERFAQAVDIQTVGALQLRAPGIYESDRNFVIQAMRTGLLFPKIIEPTQRETLGEALLRIDCFIPSIKSMHENLKYLAVGAKILKDLVLGDSVRSTLRQSLQHYWTDKMETVVEISLGEHRYITVDSAPRRWDIAYKQIWIRALRNFADLGGRSPRKEVGQPLYKATTDPHIQYELAVFASNLGFETEILESCLAHDPRRESLRVSLHQMYKSQPPDVIEKTIDNMLGQLPSHDATPPEAIPSEDLTTQEDLGRRWGVPFYFVYQMGQSKLYLPNITENMGNAFLWKDFFCSFFGPTADFPEFLQETTTHIVSSKQPSNFHVPLPEDNRPSFSEDANTPYHHPVQFAPGILRNPPATHMNPFVTPEPALQAGGQSFQRSGFDGLANETISSSFVVAPSPAGIPTEAWSMMPPSEAPRTPIIEFGERLPRTDPLQSSGAATDLAGALGGRDVPNSTFADSSSSEELRDWSMGAEEDPTFDVAAPATPQLPSTPGLETVVQSSGDNIGSLESEPGRVFEKTTTEPTNMSLDERRRSALSWAMPPASVQTLPVSASATNDPRVPSFGFFQETRRSGLSWSGTTGNIISNPVDNTTESYVEADIPQPAVRETMQSERQQTAEEQVSPSLRQSNLFQEPRRSVVSWPKAYEPIPDLPIDSVGVIDNTLNATSPIQDDHQPPLSAGTVFSPPEQVTLDTDSVDRPLLSTPSSLSLPPEGRRSTEISAQDTEPEPSNPDSVDRPLFTTPSDWSLPPEGRRSIEVFVEDTEPEPSTPDTFDKSRPLFLNSSASFAPPPAQISVQNTLPNSATNMKAPAKAILKFTEYNGMRARSLVESVAGMKVLLKNRPGWLMFELRATNVFQTIAQRNIIPHMLATPNNVYCLVHPSQAKTWGRKGPQIMASRSRGSHLPLKPAPSRLVEMSEIGQAIPEQNSTQIAIDEVSSNGSRPLLDTSYNMNQIPDLEEIGQAIPEQNSTQIAIDEVRSDGSRPLLDTSYNIKQIPDLEETANIADLQDYGGPRGEDDLFSIDDNDEIDQDQHEEYKESAEYQQYQGNTKEPSPLGEDDLSSIDDNNKVDLHQPRESAEHQQYQQHQKDAEESLPSGEDQSDVKMPPPDETPVVIKDPKPSTQNSNTIIDPDPTAHGNVEKPTWEKLPEIRKRPREENTDVSNPREEDTSVSVRRRHLDEPVKKKVKTKGQMIPRTVPGDGDAMQDVLHNQITTAEAAKDFPSFIGDTSATGIQYQKQYKEEL